MQKLVTATPQLALREEFRGIMNLKTGMQLLTLTTDAWQWPVQASAWEQISASGETLPMTLTVCTGILHGRLASVPARPMPLGTIRFKRPSICP